jgi:mRNA interferase MazF
MLSSGDVVELDLGLPVGREAGFAHPAVVVTAQRILDGDPAVVQVVPLTSTMRSFRSEVAIEVDQANGLQRRSAAQCQHVRAVSSGRVRAVHGNAGPVVLSQIREALALIFDLPT